MANKNKKKSWQICINVTSEKEPTVDLGKERGTHECGCFFVFQLKEKQKVQKQWGKLRNHCKTFDFKLIL